MQKKNLSRIALSGLLALSMVPTASMQIYADNKTAEESTSGEVRTSNRTAHVTFTVDSEKGSFTEYGTNPVKFVSDEDNDQQFVIPEVTAKEGYKFVGWKGAGASNISWGADAKTFGVTGLCFYNEGATDGFASIEAVFEPVETPVVKKTAHVTFTVDSEKGSFTEYGTNPVKFVSDEDNDQQFVIPEVTAKEGYKFVGWKGAGASNISWGADAKTFGVTGLCHFAEGETEGYASLEAVFEKVDTPAKEDNKKDDSKKDDSKKEDSKKADSKKEDSKKEDSKKEDSKKADSKKEDSKKADSKKEDNKVSTGAATGLFGSLAGVTAAGASLVALLRKKNSK